MLKVLILLFLCFSCNNSDRVYLVKQWHLSPSQITTNIQESKKIKQFEGQRELYIYVSNLVDSGLVKTILAEGCQDVEINDDFTENYNGWSMLKLKKYVNDPEFSNIMAPVQMKLKVKFPGLKVICADNNQLIKKNLNAFSEIKGNLQFYESLSKYKGVNTKLYELYSRKYKELHSEETIKDPITFSQQEALRNLNSFESFVKERNISFLKKIKHNIKNKPLLIVGGLHVKDLELRLEEDSIDYEVVSTPSYIDNEHEILELLKKKITKKEKKVIYYQMPIGFELSQFKVKQKIYKKEMISAGEEKELEKLIEGTRITKDHILSDYDSDGVRDFTISSNGHSLVLAAEDTDWDNDGIDNIVDTTLGDVSLSKVGVVNEKITIENTFVSSSNRDIVLQKLAKSNIQIIQEHSRKHELLVLDIFNKLLGLEEFSKSKAKYIKATDSTLSYGDKVFFSYIKQSRVIEYYPLKLQSYLEDIKRKGFRNSSRDEFTRGLTVPLIVHSLAHELSHSLENDIYSTAKEYGWNWAEMKYQGNYLKKYRTPQKSLNLIRGEVKYKNKNYQLWSEIHAKDGTLDFLKEGNFVSVYSLLNPSEWYAEQMSMCVFRKIYPKSAEKNQAANYINLLGINPSAAVICH